MHDPFRGQGAVLPKSPQNPSSDPGGTPETPLEPPEGSQTPETHSETSTGVSADDVPATAADVVDWIKAADDDDDRTERALVALTVEHERETARVTVMTAIQAVLDGD